METLASYQIRLKSISIVWQWSKFTCTSSDFCLRKHDFNVFHNSVEFFPQSFVPSPPELVFENKTINPFSFHTSLGRAPHILTVCCARNHPMFFILHLTLLGWFECISSSFTIPSSEQSILTHPFSQHSILENTISTPGLVQANRT